MTADIDVWGDDEHPAAYHDDPTPILIDDPDWTRHAAYHLRRIAEHKDRRDEIDRAFAKEIAHLEQRRADALAVLDRRIAWHETPLKQAHARILEADPTRKTVVLPGGQLKSRTPAKPKAKTSNADRFVEWAHVNAPHLLAVTFKPNLKQIEKAIDDGELVLDHQPAPDDPAHIVVPTSGEQIPNVHVELGPTTFSVAVDGEAL